MPWDGPEFSEKHNHKLHGTIANHVAHMANAMLRSGVPEGEAIATANKYGDKQIGSQNVRPSSSS